MSKDSQDKAGKPKKPAKNVVIVTDKVYRVVGVTGMPWPDKETAIRYGGKKR